MRAKVTITASKLSVDGNSADKILGKYPFLEDERFKPERVKTGNKREVFNPDIKCWCWRDVYEIYITIDKVEDLQYLVEMVKKNSNDEVYNGQTILMVDDDGNWELEIYDGWRE